MKEILIGTVIIVFACLLVISIQTSKMINADTPITITIEEHDYFKLESCGFTYTLCHKGNCRKCINK